MKTIFEKAINNKAYNVAVESLSPDDLPVVVTMSEFMRRMKDMAKTGGGGYALMGAMPDSYNVADKRQPRHNAEDPESTRTRKKRHGWPSKPTTSALLSQNMLTGADLTSFIKRSIELVSEQDLGI